MNILIVNRHRDDVVGGSELQCDLLARELGARGHAVTYAVMRPRHERYATPYPCRPLRAPVLLALRHVLAEVRPDVVYWRFNKPHLLAAVLLARARGAVFVFALSHDDDTRFWSTTSTPGRPGPAWRAPLRVLRRGFRRAQDALNCLGHRFVHGHVAQHAGQAAGLDPERTRVVRSSVFTASEPLRWERPCVVWVANLKARKRPEAFLELARLLSQEPVDFLAVGAMQDRRYEYLADPARVPANFRYLGALAPAAVNGVIAASLFLVLTCEPEGFPNVLMQAWNQGKPTLSLGYDPEGMIRQGRLGCVEETVPALAERVRALIHDEAERAAMGARARRFAEENFSLPANALALERFCQELLARRSAVQGARGAPSRRAEP